MPQPSEQEIEIFNLALELAPGERAAYLDKACGGDAAMRERIAELLAASDESCACLEDSTGRGGATSLPAIPAEKPGDRIGRYKLLQQIGEGGCGVVYMAEQEEPVRRKVALKVIKLGMDTKSVVARFEAERQALALMDHPNIAKIFDAGATGTGRPYFVMELVRGIRITDFCDESKLSTEERLKLFIQVCQAIQHAHQKGIIHRDIKPSNILVADHDGVAVPKIIDFGIAKATTDQRLTDKTVFTAFEQFIGTPAYMSPEQAKLSGLDIDTRSDIYSLGVLLYELLTGKTPFESKRLFEAGLDEVRRIIREEEPARPSTKLETLTAAEQTTVAERRHSDPPKLVHLIRGDLDWIVMKALEKDRARRYETANGLAMDIQRHLGDEPVLARAPGKVYLFQKMARRHKAALALAALTGTALLVATLISAWQASRAMRANKLAAARLVDSENARADSEAISRFLINVFQSPDPARDGRTITVEETLSNATKRLETDLTNQPARRAKLQSALGATYYALGLFPEAIALQEKIRDYYVVTFGLNDSNTLAAMNDLAMSYRVAGRLNEAIKLSQETLALRGKLFGPENTNTLATMNNLANSYCDAGHMDEALKLAEQLLPLCRKGFGPEDPRTLSAMGNLANAYDGVARKDEALKLREQVLTLCRKVDGSEHPATITAMLSLANSYVDAGRKDEALKLREETLTLSRKVYGPEHPHTLTAMNNLANSYVDADRKDEALKLQEETLKLSRKALGPEHPDTLGAMINLALSYASLGRQAEALQMGEQVITLCRKALGMEHPVTLTAMICLAYSYDEAGRKEEALKLREEALRLYRKVAGPEHPNTLMAMKYVAYSYDESGRKEEAFKLREQTLQLYRKVLGPENPDTLAVMEDLGDSYDATGRLNELVKLREDLLALSRKALGPEHPATLNRMSNLMDAYEKTGHRDQALKLREEGLALDRKVLGPESPDTLGVMNNLADSYDEVGRSEEALKLREEALRLRRKVLGPENPDTLGTMNNLANSYDKAGRREEALKLRKEMLALRPKVSGATLAATLNDMNTLADSYCSFGRNKDAITLMEQACALDTKDRFEALRLATFQAWFGQETNYESSRRQLIQEADGTDQAGTADKAAKVFCLRPSTNAVLLAKALALARRAVELGKSDPLLPWYELGLGLAEYRNGQYATAEQSLTIAEHTAGEVHDILGTARLFRAMSLLRQDKPDEARKVFSQAEAEMPPFPKDDHQPPAYDKSVNQDVLICWMAYKEAKALIEGPSAAVAVPSVPK